MRPEVESSFPKFPKLATLTILRRKTSSYLIFYYFNRNLLHFTGWTCALFIALTAILNVERGGIFLALLIIEIMSYIIYQFLHCDMVFRISWKEIKDIKEVAVITRVFKEHRKYNLQIWMNPHHQLVFPYDVLWTPKLPDILKYGAFLVEIFHSAGNQQVTLNQDDICVYFDAPRKDTLFKRMQMWIEGGIQPRGSESPKLTLPKDINEEKKTHPPTDERDFTETHPPLNSEGGTQPLGSKFAKIVVPEDIRGEHQPPSLMDELSFIKEHPPRERDLEHHSAYLHNFFSRNEEKKRTQLYKTCLVIVAFVALCCLAGVVNLLLPAGIALPLEVVIVLLMLVIVPYEASKVFVGIEWTFSDFDLMTYGNFTAKLPGSYS